MSVGPRRRAAYGTYSSARQDAKGQSRRALIDATCDLVLTLGAQAVTIDKIVAQAGLSRPTFYLHFQSRDDIFAALRRHMVETLDQLYDLLGVIETCEEAAITDWIMRMLAACRRDRKLVLTLMRAGTAPGMAFDPNAYYDTVIARLSLRFERFRRARTDPAIHAEALLLLMQLEGAIRYVAVGEDDRDDLRFAAPITRSFIRFVEA